MTEKRTPTLGAYALVSAAYNEEKHIQKTLQSVVEQTLLPRKWIIVSDGSTDRTDQIVRSFADEYDFIEHYRITEEHPRSFIAQVNAINTGLTRLKLLDCDFVGNLDSDVSFESMYFERLLEKFSEDPHLGLAGGFIYEEKDGEFRSRPGNRLGSVAHAVQLFRRECLDRLGGYKPLSAGTDHHAEVSVRMMGWHVQSFPDLRVFHHRPTGGALGLLRSCYRGGLTDFNMGVHPVFEVFRMIRRLTWKPYVLGALVRFTGFVAAYCRGDERQVSPEFVEFLRNEEMERLRLRAKQLPKWWTI